MSNRFIELARKYGSASQEGDPKVINAVHDELMIERDKILAQDDHGAEFFRSCLNDEDDCVVLWASLFLLPIDETQATAALERIVEKGIPRISFSAEMTLSEWRSGRLKPHG